MIQDLAGWSTVLELMPTAMFVRDAALMVFDDLSSALDVETEQRLWEGLVAVFAESAYRYGFSLVMTPIFEEVGVFVRGSTFANIAGKSPSRPMVNRMRVWP